MPINSRRVYEGNENVSPKEKHFLSRHAQSFLPRIQLFQSSKLNPQAPVFAIKPISNQISVENPMDIVITTSHRFSFFCRTLSMLLLFSIANTKKTTHDSREKSLDDTISVELDPYTESFPAVSDQINERDSVFGTSISENSLGSDESFPECLNLDTPTPSDTCSDDQNITDPKSILTHLK